MSTVTHIHLSGVPSVRIMTELISHPGKLTSFVIIDTNDGNEVSFHGQPGKLLALFRAIETSILERDPDNEIVFDQPSDGPAHFSRDAF